MKHKRNGKNKVFLSSDSLEKISNTIGLITPILVSFCIIIFDDYGYRDWFIILGVASILFTWIFTYLKTKTEREITEKYDIVREGIERDIIELQLKLAKSDDQWQASNHLILSSQTIPISGYDDVICNLSFLRNLGLKEDDFIVDQSLIFYLSSFSSEYTSVFDTCKTACAKIQMKLVRADDVFTTGDVFTQIVKYIVKASLIIVNIDGKNPNVFYELGIAHTLGKNVMLISKRDSEIPFDVRQHRILLYSNNEELAGALPKAIVQYKEFVREKIKREQQIGQYVQKSTENLTQRKNIDTQNIHKIISLLYQVGAINDLDSKKLMQILQSTGDIQN